MTGPIGLTKPEDIFAREMTFGIFHGHLAIYPANRDAEFLALPEQTASAAPCR